VVKKHGGTLEFETEQGKGTTFIIRTVHRRSAATEFMSVRILFVDDDSLLLSGLPRSLRPMRQEWISRFARGEDKKLSSCWRVSLST
jgi:hypothetical protein